MADKRTQRQQKARAKKKVRDQKRRASKRPKGSVNLQQAATWPVREAWVTSDWHTAGSSPHAVLVRQRGTEGPAAMGVYQIDTTDKGLIHAEVHLKVDDAVIGRELQTRSEPEALVMAEPELIARLVDEGIKLASANGHEVPSTTPKAQAFLGSLDPNACGYDVRLVASEDPVSSEDPQTPRPGLWQRVTGMLGLS